MTGTMFVQCTFSTLPSPPAAPPGPVSLPPKPEEEEEEGDCWGLGCLDLGDEREMWELGVRAVSGSKVWE